jgi:hypothetical protein
MAMQAHTRSIFALFDGKRRYVIPLFQRQYVWTEERQWLPLWDDIRTKADEVLEQLPDRPPHFLGAIVINLLWTSGNQVPAHEVIDGQQRLTTFQIVMAALRDVARELGVSAIADELERYCVRNSGMMADEAEEKYKVWPTRTDVPQFTHVMDLGSRKSVETQYPPQMRRKKLLQRPAMVEAYLFFHAKIRNFASEDAGDNKTRIQALFSVLRDRLQLVSIELEAKDDPQVIFETLNARGEPLLPSDLLRNFIFLRASRRKEDAKPLYDKYWAPFDMLPADVSKPDGERFWKVMERQGRMKRPRVDLFIQHFLSLKTMQEVNPGNLYRAYRDWIAKDEPYPNVEAELADLTRHAEVFRQFLVPNAKTRAGRFASRLRDLDTTTVYPLLLGLMVDNRLAAGTLDGIVEDLESFLVRRMICGRTIKNYNRLFLQIAIELRDAPKASGSIDRAAFQKVLLGKTGEAVDWPSDDALRSAWMDQPAYDRLGSGKLEMVLLALDRELLTEKGEKISIEDELTIEHVLPQAWEEFWPLPDGPNAEKRAVARDTALHTFGNLTLLTHKLNSAVRNGPYLAKRGEITMQSGLRLNSYFQALGAWDEDAIATRGKKLFDVAVKIWPRPQLVY